MCVQMALEKKNKNCLQNNYLNIYGWWQVDVKLFSPLNSLSSKE